MEFFLYVYLTIGLVFAAHRLLRDRSHILQKQEITVIGKNGERQTKDTRGATEYFLTLVFEVILWWIPLLFWAVYVPIHDRRAEMSYMDELVENEGLWVPPRLQAEVERRRAARK